MTSTIPNPAYLAYIDSKKSYRELAKIYGIQVPVLQHAISGAMPHLSPRLCAIFSDITGLPEVVISFRYDRYAVYSFNMIELPEKPLNPESTVQEWRAWRKELCRLNEIPDTVIGAASLLHVSFNVITNWEKGKTENLPLQLLSRSQGRYVN